MNANYYLGVDPGFTSGWATCDEKGELTNFGQIKDPDIFMDWLEALDPHPRVIVCEDYIIRRGVSHTGSRVPTIQLIGAIKRHARKKKIKMALQPSSAKPIGYKFAGLVPTKNHAQSHKYDAIAHIIYYLQKIGVRESRVS